MRIRYAIIAAPVLLFGVYQRRRRAKLSMVRAIQYAGWWWKKLRFRQLAAMHGDGQRRRRLLRADAMYQPVSDNVRRKTRRHMG